MNTGRIMLGIVLVGLGTVLLLDAADVIEAGDSVQSAWPAVFVLLGVIQIVVERRISVVSGLLIGAGGVALAVTSGVVDADLWALVWPIFIIGAGVWLLVRRRFPAHNSDDEVSRLAVFAPSRIVSRASAFRRADVTSFFTALRLDLTKAALAPEGAKVAATSVFGSVIVVVPKGWRVQVRGIPIFGGWDDTTSRAEIAVDAPTLRVQVLTLFGGVEVRHPDRWR